MKGKKVMMLGAGGAGRAIAVELANAGAETIRVLPTVQVLAEERNW